MQKTEAWRCPLQGQHLIEASAGTGKTFAVVTVYLRLLLGLDTPPRLPLRVNEILVVTFTEAATQELRERIRQRLHQLQRLCYGGSDDDPTLKPLLAIIEHPEIAANYLAIAERQMDEASIMTIHAFCQRILIQHAVDARTLLNQTLVIQDQQLTQQVVADYWRCYVYPLSASLVQVIHQEWAGPQELLNDLAPYLTGELPQLITHTATETITERHQRLITAIEALKMQWIQVSTLIIGLLNQTHLNKHRYPARHCSRWIQEVDHWAQQMTEDYQLPDALARFRYSILAQATVEGEPPQHLLFQMVDELYEQPLTVKDLVIAQALPVIRQELACRKRKRAEITFDDLLSQLDTALQNPGGGRLSAAISSRYPAALIDEFQDTDPIQYRIFQAVYYNYPQTFLLLIGDPKQAIYAFRGADIFTYMQARRTIHSHYTLQVNWRSSRALVNAVNQIFQNVSAPFVFDQDIPFIALKTPESAAQTYFIFRGEIQAALQFHYCDEPLTSQQYAETLAAHCASRIRDWLMPGKQQAILVHGSESRLLTASDVAVLVRTADEALLIRRALGALSIPAVYLSEQQSVFATQEALELFRCLQVLSNPLSMESLLSVLAGSLLMLDANTIEQLSQERQDERWDDIFNEFVDYQRLWQQLAVLPLLQRLFFRRQLPEKLLLLPDGKRRLTDLRHLGELLQEAAQQLATPNALLRWYNQQIYQPSRATENQQLRLESDQCLVKIITIHKSKGLEYPVVWLPFPCSFRQQKSFYYHDRQSYQAILDLRNTPQAEAWATEEQLAESVRLLYVALTRAVYHCSVGIAPVVSGRSQAIKSTNLHRSAIGYLLQQEKLSDQQRLQQALNALCSPEIAVTPIMTNFSPPTTPLPRIMTVTTELLGVKTFTRRLDSYWQISSYSALQRQSSDEVDTHWPASFLNTNRVVEFPEHLEASHFPRGITAGIFLHKLLRYLDVTQPLQSSWLTEQLVEQGLDTQWNSLLQRWLPQILQTPLNSQGLCLQQLTFKHKCCELGFYLPIERLLQPSALEALMRHYDPISRQTKPLIFSQVYGMLQGSIDLVFYWQGRYYLLDYKSNWLGESVDHYQLNTLIEAMISHRYDLQYQLYSVALHRYLSHRLPDYRYDSHFGGVFYLFLRGMTGHYDGKGVFFHKPAGELITALDDWLANRTMTDAINNIKTGGMPGYTACD